MNTDLIITCLAAHRNFMYYRMSTKEKMKEFLSKTKQILETLEAGKTPILMKLPKNNCGQNIAIDIYKEICYNIEKRFT